MIYPLLLNHSNQRRIYNKLNWRNKTSGGRGEMKTGKALEQLVAIIQEHLKDKPDVKITRNAILTNRSGNKREIDVFVQTKVNGVVIGIAFECKDYSRKITEPTIDSFWAKINDLPQINKGILVTTTGYTSGAQREAAEHKIGLYLINDVPIDQIMYSCKFYGARLIAEPIFDAMKAHFVADEPNVTVDPETRVRYADNSEEVDLFRAVFSSIYTLKVECQLAAKYMELGKKAYIIGLRLSSAREIYIEDVRGIKYKIDFFEIPVKVDCLMEACQMASRKEYSTINNENVVSVSEYSTSMNESSCVVVESGNDKHSFYIKNDDAYYSPDVAISGQRKV